MRPSRASQAGTSGTEAASVQEDVLQELQQQLAVRQQQLDLANEQIKDLVQHLALKRDAVQFAEQRAAMLQHQVCVQAAGGHVMQLFALSHLLPA
jgi:isopenicillin N synthase-like dioxygenase